MAHSAPHSRPPPRNTPWHDPWPTKRRARVSHARNASVTLAIRNLGMKRRRTSYPTPKSTHALSVSEFWVIFPEGPKRQPTAPWGMVHRHRRRHRQTTLLPYSRTASRSVRPLITAREARTDLRGKPRPTERTNARALPCRISTQTANAKRLSPEPREGSMRQDPLSHGSSRGLNPGYGPPTYDVCTVLLEAGPPVVHLGYYKGQVYVNTCQIRRAPCTAYQFSAAVKQHIDQPCRMS